MKSSNVSFIKTDILYDDYGAYEKPLKSFFN